MTTSTTRLKMAKLFESYRVQLYDLYDNILDHIFGLLRQSSLKIKISYGLVDGTSVILQSFLITIVFSTIDIRALVRLLMSSYCV